MSHPEDIDDLFRQQLDGHATPPAPDLWARLSLPAAGTDPVDATFQDGLRGYATPPRRELWERLEDEYLRPQPRRRRVAAWWQLSAAAVLLLMLLAGGGLLWRGSYQGISGGGVAHVGSGNVPTQANQQAAETMAPTAISQPQPVAQPQPLATVTTPATTPQKKNQENFSTQATASHASTSSTPIAATARSRRPATTLRASRRHQMQSPQPDAAVGSLARTGGRQTPAGQSLPTSPTPTPTTQPTDSPTLASAPVAPAATPEIIEVEVRRGGIRPAAETTVADAPPAPTRRRGLRLGSLLRQADHLVHGEPVSLAEATGLPQTVTLQARLGGRLVSKTIQL